MFKVTDTKNLYDGSVMASRERHHYRMERRIFGKKIEIC